MPLTFQNAARSWDADQKVVVFAGSDGPKAIRCMIATDALTDHFGLTTPDEMNALRAFDRCRFAIEEAASRKYDRWKLAAAGEVSLRSRDFGRR
jgi:Protein of unknown function (DUF1488)